MIETNLLRLFFLFVLVFVNSSCKKVKDNKLILIKNNKVKQYAKTITQKELKDHLYIFASDDMEGRMTGQRGQKKAADYIKDYYIKNNIGFVKLLGSYYQKFEVEHKGKQIKTENVLGFIEGTDKKNEVIIISAHYDHLGKKDGKIFNGADDDGTGNVGMFEIAQAFKKAKEEGNGPRRSILFLHFTGEELGLLGSDHYTKNPIIPLKNTICDLNIDMVGRIDEKHKGNENYIYLIGADKISQDLHDISEWVNNKYSNIDFDYTYNDENEPNRVYYRSDHYNFVKKGIPVIFYSSGVHKDYHKYTDTVEKINYPLLEKRIKLIFYTAWELANRNDKLRIK